MRGFVSHKCWAVLLATIGCTTSPPPAADSGLTDAGVNDTPLQHPNSCSSDTECGEGAVCHSGLVPLEPEVAGCFFTCDAVGASCDSYRGTGICRSLAGSLVCVELRQAGALCGSPEAATCDDGLACAQLSAPFVGVGVCGTPCRRDLECGGGSVCSLTAFDSGAESEGLCVPPTQPGDACGVDLQSGDVVLCGGSQVCVGAPEAGACSNDA